VIIRLSEWRIEPQFYPLDYFEQLCERAVVEFCNDFYGQELAPLPTDVLTQLLERHTSVLNLYAALDEGIEGMTTMFGNECRPQVDIAAELSRQWFRENRLRTTLAHELAHVLLHAPLWRAQCAAAGRPGEARIAQACRRETIEDHASRNERSDRIEWQARYIGGALLMPKRRLDRLVSRFLSSYSTAPVLVAGSAEAEELVERVSIGFRVSRDAARVRLRRVGVVRDDTSAGS
jgi:IrrE N-terminal-like domain